MMRILFLITAMPLLSSCISVDDFGRYWNEATVDHAVLGWWHNPADEGKIKTRVMNHAGIYYIDKLDDGWEIPDESMRARTLKIGHYSFLMMKIRSGRQWVPFGMYRYKIEGDKMWAYTLNAGKMQGFLSKKYQGSENIRAVICQKKRTIGCITGDRVSIGKLDKSVYKILSIIPDTEEFWTLEKSSMAQKIRQWK